MRHRVLIPLTIAVTTGLAFAALAGEKDKKAPAPAAVAPPAAWTTAAKDQKWQPFDPKNPKGPQIALLSGDFKGPTGLIMKMPVGAKAGVHAHTSDYYGVVLSGNPVHGDTEATAKANGPGSSWFEPAKHMHYDGCPGPAECIVVLNFAQSGPDYIPAVAAAPAPAPAPAPPAKK